MERSRSTTPTPIVTKHVRVAENGSPVLRCRIASTPQALQSRRFTARFISPPSPSRYGKIKHPEPNREPLVDTAQDVKAERPRINDYTVVDRRITLVQTLTRVRIAATRCIEDATTAHRLMVNFVTICLATEESSDGFVQTNQIAARCVEVIRACHAIVAVVVNAVASLQDGDDGMLEQVGAASLDVLMLCSGALTHAQEMQGLLGDVSVAAGELKSRVMERRLWDVRERLLGIVGWIGR